MPTVMIVDDEELIRRMLTRVLTHAGYTVVTHDKGFGLTYEVRAHCPSLLVLDIDMPGLTGDAALSVLRGFQHRFRELRVPVVFHSGMARQRLETLAQRHGAAGVLSKPVGNAELLATVAACLQSPPEGVSL